MTDEELVMGLIQAANAEMARNGLGYVPPERLLSAHAWLATARRAKELLPAMTDAEEELIEAALEHTDTTIALPLRLEAAAARVLAERKRGPRERWIAWEFGIKDTHSGVVWTPLTFEANNGGGVSLRDATLAALNAQPPR